MGELAFLRWHRIRLPDHASGPLVFLAVGLPYLGLTAPVLWFNQPQAHVGAGFSPAAGVALGAMLLLRLRPGAIESTCPGKGLKQFM
jgi:hypothetical protein